MTSRSKKRVVGIARRVATKVSVKEAPGRRYHTSTTTTTTVDTYYGARLECGHIREGAIGKKAVICYECESARDYPQPPGTYPKWEEQQATWMDVDALPTMAEAKEQAP